MSFVSYLKSRTIVVMVLIRYDILYDIIKVGHFDTFVGNYASYVKGILCLKACYNK